MNISIKKSTTLILVLLLTIATISANINQVFAQKMSKERSFPNANKAKNEEPITLGTAACLIDAKTGHIVYGVDENEKNFPASTTKIMTGLLAMENLELDQDVTVDEDAAKAGGSQLYLNPGEVLSVEDLLYGMMLPSANDAAVALGKAMAPSIEEFAELMNKKAKSLGAVNTNFVNPNGLPDDNHYTTAYDLALIAKEAMKYEEFRKIVTTYEYTIPKSNMSVKRLMHNRNRLLYNINRKVEVYGETKSIKYDGVTGIKTGYTDKAKFCLVGSAKRGNTEFIAVTMKSEDMNGYQDVISMLDYGFNNYKTSVFIDENKSVDDVEIEGGEEKYGKAKVKEGLYITVPKDVTKSDITVKKKFKEIKAPYKSGTKAGKLEAYYDGEKVGETEVILTEAMKEGSKFSGILFKILLIPVGLVLLVLILRTINKMRRRARRRRRRKIDY